MNNIQLKFISECPAWAQRLGVKDLKIWKIIANCMPLGKSQRFDYVESIQHADDMLDRITAEDKILILQVVGSWDEMAGTEI